MAVDPCLDQNLGRRRTFWSTMQGVCGSYDLCGVECSIPGLQYVDSEEGRTISNDDRLNSLILNILNTRARTDMKCPAPTAVYGHWSESYRDDNLWIGSRLWNAASKPYIRVADAVKAISAAIKGDLMKLMAMGVADSVEVEAVYKGRNRVDVVVVATYRRARHVLNLSGTYASDTWVWH